MPNQAILLLILLTLTASLPALDFSLSQFIEQKDVVIVGENHRRSESIQLISETVAKYLEAGECLIVALEIDSDQQGILERALKGKVPVSSISIFPTIDFPAYREMLSSFQDHVKNGRCLTPLRFCSLPPARLRPAARKDGAADLGGRCRPAAVKELYSH